MHTSETKLLDFQIKDMVIKMQQLASELWDMLGLLLSANSHEACRGVSPDAGGKVPMREPNVLTLEEMKMDPNQMAKCQEALITIVH
jgi:hypothetical protein